MTESSLFSAFVGGVKQRHSKMGAIVDWKESGEEK